MMKEDTVLIIGSGSMACLFAACLVRSGQDVLMFSEWEEGVRAIQEHGIRLHDSQGDQPAVHPSATTRPNDCAGARNVLLLVKSWQTETAAELLKTRLHPRGVVLTLQNGLGNDEILAAALGKKRTAAGITTLGAYMLGPAHIHAELGGEVILAEHPALAELHSRLQQAGLTVSQVPDLASLQWGKTGGQQRGQPSFRPAGSLQYRTAHRPLRPPPAGTNRAGNRRGGGRPGHFPPLPRPPSATW